MFENVNELIDSVDVNPDSIICQHGLLTEGYVKSHKHDKAQFLYCEGGIVYIKTEAKTYYLPSRHYIWIAPNDEHYIIASSEKVMVRVLYFPVQQHNEFTQTTGIYPINEFLLEYLLHISNLAREILPSEQDNYTIANSFYLLLRQYSKYSLPLTLPTSTDEKMMEIINYLNDNLSSKITLDSLARNFNLSQRSITRLFSNELKMTFIEYLTILRILKALELLLETRKSISEICFSVGYNSVPTFSNVFHKLIGMRPVDYRKEKKQKLKLQYALAE